jgi:putative transposase
VWACDFLQATSLFFRSLFAFFIIDLKSCKVIHVNVTRCPTDLWVAQQLREATPYGHTPTYLIREKFSSRWHLSTRWSDAEDAVVVRGRIATPIAVACEHPE